MSSTKLNHNYHIDLIRIFFAAAVFLFHTNLLKGGYLAVCGFFVMTGYFTCQSVRKDDFSLKKFYLGRLKKIYLPLVIVVFITVLVINFSKNIIWVSMKPEASSVLFGYNNFWQIKVNNDYFARSAESPFVHFWYIAILLQFELIFPPVFLIIKKCVKNPNARVVRTIADIIAAALSGILLFDSFTKDMMSVYYGTLTRLFSIAIGVSLAFSFKAKSKSGSSKPVFYLIIAAMAVLMYSVDSQNQFYGVFMVLFSILSANLLSCSLNMSLKADKAVPRVLKYIGDITYEFYLVQYPVIYLLDSLHLFETKALGVSLTFVLTLSFAIMLHWVVAINKKTKAFFKIAVALILVLSLAGGVCYVTAKDNTAEMEALKEELERNEAELKAKQEEYAKKSREEARSFDEKIKKLDEQQSNVTEAVKNMPITFIGDSVMLGAAPSLNKVFTDGLVDAAVSRSGIVGVMLIDEYGSKNMLGDAIVFNLGVNGGMTDARMHKIMDSVDKNKQVFWINIPQNAKWDGFNDVIEKFVASGEYENAHLIDWRNYSHGHTEYFSSDGLHLRNNGGAAYTDYVLECICKVYKDAFAKTKAELIEKHNAAMNSKITFCGNDLMLGLYDYLFAEYPGAHFISTDQTNYAQFKDALENYANEGSIEHNLVIGLNRSLTLTKSQYRELFDFFSGNEIYVIKTNERDVVDSVSAENVHVIDFSGEILSHPEYLLSDKRHLSAQGSRALSDFIVLEFSK